MNAGLGWGALVIAGLGLVLVLGRLPNFLGGLGRSSEGGRWIRDRSLGGKMVGRLRHIFVQHPAHVLC